MLSTKVNEKSTEKLRSVQWLIIILLTAVAVFLIMGESALAKGWKKKAEELEPVNVFIEWNSTEEDQGIQFFWDSDGFTRMMVFNESGKKVLDIETKKSVRDQGLTEVAIESVEPEGSEQTLDDFFERFPEGTYEFWGRSIEGNWLYGEADFTHDLLEPVVFTDTSLPNISWTAPSQLLSGEPSEVVGYEMVVELVVMENGDERVFKETTTLPGDATSYLVSATFLDLINSFDPEDIVVLKIEILADEESGNRTITETPAMVMP